MLDMPRLSITLCIGTALAAVAGTNAFSTTPVSTQAPNFSRKDDNAPSTTTTLLLQRPVSGRHFQLEELEDAETSTTDVLLNADMTVTLGGTNGPLYTASSGTWSESSQFLKDDQNEPEEFKRMFELKLTRRFITGADGPEGTTEIGEFEYDVERTYRGECFIVGESTFAMNGEILDVDEVFGDRRLGFFNMIDTTEERENNAMGA